MTVVHRFQFCHFADSQRLWGGKCDTCLGACAGYYLPSEKVVEYVKKNGFQCHAQPPSLVIKTLIKENANPTEKDIQGLAKKCLLSLSNTQYLVDHLKAIEQRKELR